MKLDCPRYHLGEVVDQGGDAVGIDRFKRVQQHEQDRLVDVVFQIPRESEHKAGHLAFALEEVGHRVPVGHARRCQPGDVQREGLGHCCPPARLLLPFDAFEPDAVEVRLVEQIQAKAYCC